MFNLSTPKCCCFTILIYLVLITISTGCAAQPSDITPTRDVDQPGTEGPSSCLTSMEAMNSVGKTACVEFFVGNPSQFKGEVFLNEKSDYTKGFQAVILADSLKNFNDPVSQYRSKTIRVRGLIVEYDGHPGIIVSAPSDIDVVR